MPRGEKCQRMIAGLEPFQRRQRFAELGDKFGGDVEFIVGNQPARVAVVKVVAIAAKSRQRLRETVAAGARARPAQQRALKRGDGYGVGALFSAKSQQGMLEQRQKRHRFKAAERRVGGEPREYAGLRVGEAIAAG